MNTIKFLAKTYESDPYFRTFFDAVAKDAYSGTPVLAAMSKEITRLNQLLVSPKVAQVKPTTGQTQAPWTTHHKRMGRPAGTPNKPKPATPAQPVDPGAAQVIKTGRVATPATTQVRKNASAKKAAPQAAPKIQVARKAERKGLPFVSKPETETEESVASQ